MTSRLSAGPVVVQPALWTNGSRCSSTAAAGAIPGRRGSGWWCRRQDGTPLVTLGRYIGRATNNVAEYRALITALERAKELGAKRILIRGDSELIIKQMRGEYRVKHPDMRVLYDQAQELVREFEDVKIEHNLRHKNELADKLANLAMDRRADVTDVNGAAPADPVPPTRGGTSSPRRRRSLGPLAA